MRFKLLLSYEGTAYSGWQVQAGIRPLPTIQGTVETALFKLTGQKINVHGSGRTDAGVHAFGQVAHFDLYKDPGNFAKRLNCVLPSDIRVISCAQVAQDFHAIRDAVSKTYIYYFWQESGCVPPWIRNFIWGCGPVNLDLMEDILPGFLGEHDFTSFRNSGSDVSTSVRKIMDIKLIRNSLPNFPAIKERSFALEITASGFLKQMVRNMAGFLICIGQRKVHPESLEAIFSACDRQALPSPTAPARGLFLAKVEYDKDYLLPPTIKAPG